MPPGCSSSSTRWVAREALLRLQGRERAGGGSLRGSRGLGERWEAAADAWRRWFRQSTGGARPRCLASPPVPPPKPPALLVAGRAPGHPPGCWIQHGAAPGAPPACAAAAPRASPPCPSGPLPLLLSLVLASAGAGGPGSSSENLTPVSALMGHASLASLHADGAPVRPTPTPGPGGAAAMRSGPGDALQAATKAALAAPRRRWREGEKHVRKQHPVPDRRPQSGPRGRAGLSGH